MQGTPSTERKMRNIRPYVNTENMVTAKYNRIYSLVDKVPVVYANENEETKAVLRHLAKNGVKLNIDAKTI